MRAFRAAFLALALAAASALAGGERVTVVDYSQGAPVRTSRQLTAQEQAALEASRLASLPSLKAAKVREIEDKTQRILARGVEYPAGSGTWHALTVDRIATQTAAKSRANALSWPRRFKARSAAGAAATYTVTNAAAFELFDAALTAAYAAAMDAELDLLEAVAAAATPAELAAVSDNREEP